MRLFLLTILCAVITSCSSVPSKHVIPTPPPLPPGVQEFKASTLKSINKPEFTGKVYKEYYTQPTRYNTNKLTSLTGSKDDCFCAILDWQANQLGLDICQAVNISQINTNVPGPLFYEYNRTAEFIRVYCPIEPGMEIWFLIRSSL